MADTPGHGSSYSPKNTSNDYETRDSYENVPTGHNSRNASQLTSPRTLTRSSPDPNIVQLCPGNDKVPESAEITPACCEAIQDSVCIIDSRGQTLEPGDAVWIGSGSGKSVYVGNQQTVLVEWNTDRVIKKETLELTEPFGKYIVTSGQCPIFPPRKRVERALARIGTSFIEGNGWVDGFPEWIYTGLVYDKASEKGFGLWQ